MAKMTPTNFQGHWFYGSGFFFEGLTIYGNVSHHGDVTQMPGINFCSPTHGGSTLNLALIGKSVSEKNIFETGLRH